MLCTEGQPFGGNYNPIYSGIGLRGHPGQDWSCGWASPILSKYGGNAYKIFSAKNTTNSDGFTEFDIIVEDGLECFEWQVGHLDPFDIAPESLIGIGQEIGTEANHGPVYSGNIPISIAMQKAGDERGHHRHYQKRPLMKVKVSFGKMLAGMNGATYKDEKGYMYSIWNFNNGYNGCVDPTLPVFTRTLGPDTQGYDVYVMQRILQKEGYLTVEPTGYFAEHTTVALMEYQNSKSLPMVGYAGPQTRAALSQSLQGVPNLAS